MQVSGKNPYSTSPDASNCRQTFDNLLPAPAFILGCIHLTLARTEINPQRIDALRRHRLPQYRDEPPFRRQAPPQWFPRFPHTARAVDTQPPLSPATEFLALH